MGRLLLFGIVALVLDVFALVDVALIERSRVRAFPKLVWILIILVVPFVGALLWFLVGRDWRRRRGERRVIAPDDDPAFLRSLAEQEAQEERIRRLEQELAELDDDSDPR
jgi:type VI protein secretion system component VasK